MFLSSDCLRDFFSGPYPFLRGCLRDVLVGANIRMVEGIAKGICEGTIKCLFAGSVKG